LNSFETFSHFDRNPNGSEKQKPHFSERNRVLVKLVVTSIGVNRRKCLIDHFYPVKAEMTRKKAILHSTPIRYAPQAESWRLRPVSGGCP
jgi:hypothetical protein